MCRRAQTWSAGVLASLALAFCGAGADAAPRSQRPNILLILADDMGYSDVGAYGGEIYTPSIDRLAAQGVRFTNFHTSAYCAPTRSMLMTGADNHVVGLGNMPELLADNQIGKPGYGGAERPSADDRCDSTQGRLSHLHGRQVAFGKNQGQASRLAGL
jgi:arylsulfatase